MLNESTQVYIDGTLPTTNTNNLEIITKQLDNGKRAPNQIYSILRGMGVPENRCLYAIENYVNTQTTTTNNMQGYGYRRGKGLRQNFNFGTLLDLLNTIRGEIETLKGANNNKINYAATSSFDIIEKNLGDLQNLSKNINEYNLNENNVEKLKIIESKINPVFLKSRPEFYFGIKVLNELYKFNSLDIVNKFTTKLKSLLEDNKYSSIINNTLYELNNQNLNSYYKNIIEDLEYLATKDENYIYENLSIVLNKHTWIPTIKNILLEYKKDSNILVSENYIQVNKVVSPVQINQDNSVVFAIDENVFIMHNNKMAKVENKNNLSQVFLTLNESFKNFVLYNDKISYYNNDQVLDYVFESNDVLLNGSKVDHTNITNFKNHLISNSFIRLNEQYKLDNIFFVLEYFDFIKEIDIATQLYDTTKDIKVNIFKLDENTIYINKVHKISGINELIKAKDATHARELVLEFINYDISNMVKENLNKEFKFKQELLDEKEEIIKKIDFLNTKKSQINEQILKIGTDKNLVEAINILNEEIKQQEIALEQIYSKISESSYINEASFLINTVKNIPESFNLLVDANLDGITQKIYINNDQYKSKDRLIECYYKRGNSFVKSKINKFDIKNI